MTARPHLFLLHGLGGSARHWDSVAQALGDRFDTVAIDLPGFGQAAASIGTDVAGMADHVVEIIRASGSPRWLVAGHSMGGKIASVVAARSLAGEAGLFGLAGVVLLAGSPPSPEPMDESRRQTMIDWAADGMLDDRAARTFIDDNVGEPLRDEHDRLAVADLKRTSREAWLAWLERGSREDWTTSVGTLEVPALIIVGGADGDLGEQGQRATNLKVYPRARLTTLAGAGHLLALERTAAVAEAISRFWRDEAGLGPSIPTDFANTIASGRVSRRTRSALAARALADDPAYAPRALTLSQFATLRAVAARVVPQGDDDSSELEDAMRMPGSSPGRPGGRAHIDLAARLDAQLAHGQGDGWRFAVLPADGEAYACALDALKDFGDMTGEAQDALLTEMAAGRFATNHAGGRATTAFSPMQMQRWFEDARSDLVRLWLAHPATMARIGFDGFANGGDGPRKQGFERLGAGEREAWEPLPLMALTPLPTSDTSR